MQVHRKTPSIAATSTQAQPRLERSSGVKVDLGGGAPDGSQAPRSNPNNISTPAREERMKGFGMAPSLKNSIELGAKGVGQRELPQGSGLHTGRLDDKGQRVTLDTFSRERMLADLANPWSRINDLAGQKDGFEPGRRSPLDLIGETRRGPHASDGKNHVSRREQQGNNPPDQTQNAGQTMLTGGTLLTTLGTAGGGSLPGMANFPLAVVLEGTGAQLAVAGGGVLLAAGGGVLFGLGVDSAVNAATGKRIGEWYVEGVDAASDAVAEWVHEKTHPEDSQPAQAPASQGGSKGGDASRPNPMDDTGGPVRIPVLGQSPEAAPKTRSQQEAARRRQVAMPGEGRVTHERMYMDPAELKGAIVAKRTDGRVQPNPEGSGVDTGGGTEAPGRKHMPGKGQHPGCPDDPMVAPGTHNPTSPNPIGQ